MNILFTVCGRAGSKGVKNKNLKIFCGYPLVYYTMAAIDMYRKKYGAGNIVHTALNTDSDDLVSLVLAKYPDTAVIHREAGLAGDSVGKIAVIKDTLLKAEHCGNITYDMVVDLDITSPLRRVEDVCLAVTKKHEESKLDIIFSVTNARRNPYFNMVQMEEDGSCKKVLQSSYTARQHAPPIFDMNASIYAYNPDFLRKNTSGLLFDGKCGFIEMMDTAVLDIDSEEDFLLMEVIAKHIYEHYPDYREIPEMISGIE